MMNEQLQTKLYDMEAETERFTVEDVEQHVNLVKSEIAEHENQARLLQDSVKSVAKDAEELRAQRRVCRAKNGELTNEVTASYDTLNELESEDQRLASKLADQKALKVKLEEALEVSGLLRYSFECRSVFV